MRTKFLKENKNEFEFLERKGIVDDTEREFVERFSRYSMQVQRLAFAISSNSYRANRKMSFVPEPEGAKELFV